jgi:hypothetical protein
MPSYPDLHTPSVWALEKVMRDQSEQIAAMEATIKSLLEGREELFERLAIVEQRLAAMRDWGE